MFFRLLQRSQSDMHISDLIPMTKLEANSRSLSTWVAVGDTSATTQLPSPQVGIITSLLPKAFHEKNQFSTTQHYLCFCLFVLRHFFLLLHLRVKLTLFLVYFSSHTVTENDKYLFVKNFGI